MPPCNLVWGFGVEIFEISAKVAKGGIYFVEIFLVSVALGIRNVPV